MMADKLENIWKSCGFAPNENQQRAIEHTDGPLFLTAGPGSGKTRVLLWRATNLIAVHGINPSEIFLATFTEKAARQLKQGLQVLLGVITNATGQTYDISNMYVGTIHSLCQRILQDRRFSPEHRRGQMPELLDQISQYFYIYDKKHFDQILANGAWTVTECNAYLGNVARTTGAPLTSRHQAVVSCISLFNRFSEECIEPATAEKKIRDKGLKKVLRMYAGYRSMLAAERPPRTDLSLLQQEALTRVQGFSDAKSVFKHVIVDEYQDTNTVQERLLFRLATGTGNICVVGDDDQALYRFRGATVENFVDFPDRCAHYLKRRPTQIPLNINYRSRQAIVEFCKRFMKSCDWRGNNGRIHRVRGKNIVAHRSGKDISIVRTSRDVPDQTCQEIAQVVSKLLKQGKVQDPNQIAFLYPSLHSKFVERMIDALCAVGLKVYAPRAGRFLDLEEPALVIGLMMHVFGKPDIQGFGRELQEYKAWCDECYDLAKDVCRGDRPLRQFIATRQEEVGETRHDFLALKSVAQKQGWADDAPFVWRQMQPKLIAAPGISNSTKRSLESGYFRRMVERRAAERPITLRYVIASSTSLDWSLLDLFYQLTAFGKLKAAFDLGQSGKDEAGIYNLAQMSSYLARFMDERGSVLTGGFLLDGRFSNTFFGSYIYGLYRLGETEIEDDENPFPKGRIPFLTIHQAKGLEFPVVVLGNPCRRDKGPQFTERTVRPLLEREGEPLNRTDEFDVMRMFYVALSRAQNLLIVAHPRGRGVRMHEGLDDCLEEDCPSIEDLDIGTVPAYQQDTDALPKAYSYTADYLVFDKCPRQYMVFRKYGFVPSRAQTQFFGSLVHKTIEDLHHMLMHERAAAKAVTA
jgi:DNA helicase-2/ATP-dependent DNA helicase PcrA